MSSHVITPETERVAMQRRITELESRCGALMVDAERREQRAREIAVDCTAHGTEIQYLRHLASWCWSNEQDAGEARQAVVLMLIQLQKDLAGRTEDMPIGRLREWVEKTRAAYDRSFRGKSKFPYPTLADCQRDGGCDHDDVIPGLKAELGGAR